MSADAGKTVSGFSEWSAGFSGLGFRESAERVRDKILESPELDRRSREYFSDAFDYVMELEESGRPLNVDLMRIRMTEIKGYGELNLEEFARTLLLLSLCGFSFSYGGSGGAADAQSPEPSRNSSSAK